MEGRPPGVNFQHQRWHNVPPMNAGHFLSLGLFFGVLALGFLILIGFMLFLEALEYKVPKGYIYFAVAFSLLIKPRI